MTIRSASPTDDPTARLAPSKRGTASETRQLTELARLVGSTGDVDEILAAVCRRSARLCGADRATIFLWGDDPSKVRPASSEPAVGEREEEYWRRLRNEGERPLEELRLNHHLATTGAPIHIEDARSSALVNQDSVENFELRTLLGVPLVADGEVIGALTLDRRRVEGFSEHQRELAAAVADQVALVLQRELMLEKTRSQLRQAEALLEIARSLSSTLEIQPLLKTLAQQTASACEMERCSIYLWDEGRILPVMSQFADGHSSKRLWKAFQDLKDQPLEEIPFLAEAVHQRAPVVIHDSSDDPRMSDVMAVFELRSLVTVPLVRRGAVVGAMSIDMTSRPRKITAGQVNLAETIAGQFALVLENVDNYQRAQDALEELRTAQERLVQSEKVRALAEMAGGVAHDFNNLLTAILGHTQVLIRDVDAGRFDRGEGRRHLGVIERAARDGAETVRRLLEFTRSKPRHGKAEAVDVNQALRHTLEVSRPRWKNEAEARGITIETALDLAEVPAAAADGAELREVLLNLTINAVEAMPGGGTLTLKSHTDGEWIAVDVRDTGVGMAPELHRRIFDPFFTTKGPQSSGLGLCVSYGIVRRQGGDIDFDSQPGSGSCFTVRLRPHPEARAPRKSTADATVPRALRVLVVDDEAAVRELLGEVLAIDGHRVWKAGSGPEGVEVLERERVDLVLTDLGMPGMTGWDVAAYVKGHWPGVKVGLISGWGAQVEPGEVEKHGVDFLCSKPFEVQELLRTLAAL